jgi:hypothetical protein
MSEVIRALIAVREGVDAVAGAVPGLQSLSHWKSGCLEKAAVTPPYICYC